MKKTTQQWFWILAFVWLVFTLLQAFFTEVVNDETYYWRYAQRLDWAYFDHPPMIAVWIAAWDWIPGALGVRMMPILSGVATMGVLFFGLLDKKYQTKESLFALFVFAFFLPILHLYSFVATPDAPLLFFSVVFLTAYKYFLNQNNWRSVFLLALSMATLLYSKYHGVLLIGFTLLSNLSLLKNPKFYMASIFGAMCFFPHLYWQYANDFPSFRYHLIERTSTFQTWHIPEYFLNIILVYNPFMWFLYYRVFKKVNQKEQLTKTYLWIIFGTLIFFLLSLRNGHVQPQWTIIICIPLLVLLVQYFYNNQQTTAKYLRQIAWVYVPLMVGVRIVIATDLVPFRTEFHGNERWAKALRKALPDQYILFVNSYQHASSFAFYDGQNPCTTIREYDSRKNQYDLWGWEEKYFGKKVFVEERLAVNNDSIPLPDNRYIFGKTVAHFQPLKRIAVKFDKDSLVVKPQSVHYFNVELTNPYHHKVQIGAATESQILFYLVNKKEEIYLLTEIDEDSIELAPLAKKTIQCKVTMPDKQGAYKLFPLIKFRTIAFPPTQKCELSFVALTMGN